MNTYLDPNSWQAQQISDTIQNAVSDLAALTLIEKLKPDFSKDGNMYCFLYGNLPNDCVVGFGETAAAAMNDFYTNFYNQKA